MAPAASSSEPSQQQHSHPEEQYSRGRRLFGVPVLLQDWDNENEEGAFQYWELFLDLLLVAAASSITDQLKGTQNVGEFVVFYLIILNGWLLYTHHITSRFQDNSLAHSMVLFVFCVGFGYEIVNLGYDYTRDFCYGAILQRGSVLIMLLSIAVAIPRARAMCLVYTILIAVSMSLLLAVATLLDGHAPVSERPFLYGCFWLVAIMEFFGEAIIVKILSGRQMVPVNIDQTKERLGAMELVFLGESVLSVCIIYREFQAEGKTEDGNTTRQFYQVLGWSFLLIFMFLLLYFHMQPNPTDHALRRSRFHGTCLILLHRLLGLAYLAVGTAVKLIVERVLEGDEEGDGGGAVAEGVEDPSSLLFAAQLLGYGVGISILLLFGMRWLHYAGRGHINFGTQTMHYKMDPHLDRLASTWWLTVFVAGLLPIIGVASGWTMGHEPVTLTALHAGFVFWLVGMESFFSHLLQDGAEQQASRRSGEQQGLLSSGCGEIQTYS